MKMSHDVTFVVPLPKQPQMFAAPAPTAGARKGAANTTTLTIRVVPSRGQAGPAPGHQVGHGRDRLCSRHAPYLLAARLRCWRWWRRTGAAAEAQRAEREIVLNSPAADRGRRDRVHRDAGRRGRRGQTIEIATAAGRSLGVISPFGARVGQDAGTYTVPVPADAIRDGRIAVRLTIRQGDATRAPTTEEVRGMKLSIVGSGR